MTVPVLLLLVLLLLLLLLPIKESDGTGIAAAGIAVVTADFRVLSLRKVPAIADNQALLQLRKICAVL